MKDIDFEQELYNHFGQVKDFTLGMRIGQYFYNLCKEQTEKRWLEDRDGCFWDGVEEGKKAMKKQMMRSAVEGMIDYVYDEKGDAYKAIRLDWIVGDFGDKVKVIVLPKED